MVPQVEPPLTGPEGEVLAQPVAALEKRLIKTNNKAVVRILVQWANLPREAATWEDYHHVVQQFPSFDPWGQGSTGEEGNVMTLNVETEKLVAEKPKAKKLNVEKLSDEKLNYEKLSDEKLNDEKLSATKLNDEKAVVGLVGRCHLGEKLF